MEITDGPVKNVKGVGIISIKGDVLKICSCRKWATAKRPEKFESTKDNMAFLFELKKKAN